MINRRRKRAGKCPKDSEVGANKYGSIPFDDSEGKSENRNE